MEVNKPVVRLSPILLSETADHPISPNLLHLFILVLKLQVHLLDLRFHPQGNSFGGYHGQVLRGIYRGFINQQYIIDDTYWVKFGIHYSLVG